MRGEGSCRITKQGIRGKLKEKKEPTSGWCKERIKLSHWIYFTILHQRILASTTEKRYLVSVPRTFLKHKVQNKTLL